MRIAYYLPCTLQTLQRVDLPDPVTAVTAGHYHTLALTTSGKRLQCSSVPSAVVQHMCQCLLQEV
jgi:hypothetical protein